MNNMASFDTITADLFANQTIPKSITASELVAAGLVFYIRNIIKKEFPDIVIDDVLRIQLNENI